MKTLNVNQQSVINELCGAYCIDAVLFNPSSVAGTFDRLNAIQIESISNTALKFNLTFTAFIAEGTFLFAL